MPNEFFLCGGGQTHLVHLRALPDVDPQVVPDEREQRRGEVDLGFFAQFEENRVSWAIREG